MSANQLQKAVVERLSTDPGHCRRSPARTGSLTGASPAPSRPIWCLARRWQRDFSTGDEAGTEHRFEIEAWTKQTAASRRSNWPMRSAQRP
jgi:hypothetical protein